MTSLFTHDDGNSIAALALVHSLIMELTEAGSLAAEQKARIFQRALDSLEGSTGRNETKARTIIERLK